jgi:heme oxygenase
MLSVLGRETERAEYELEFDLAKHYGWCVVAEGAEAGLTVVRKEIVKLLKQMGPLSPKDGADHLEKHRATVRKQLRTLVANGTLRQDDNGKYFVPPVPPAEART